MNYGGLPLESELIQQAAQGDHEAYELLMRRYEEPVFRLAYLILGDPDDAQDVAQDTFIRAYRHLPRFDAGRPLRPWLLQITRNLARNRQRSFNRYLAALSRALITSPQTESSAESEHIQQGETRALWQAIRQLDRQDQEIIYLRYFLNCSVDETAATLDIQPGTVKSRLSRALQRLRGVVQEDFPLLMEGRQL
jgi:RNA polymerase sigma-70 factor (ECF subfamily)